MSKIFEAYEQLLSQGVGDKTHYTDEQAFEESQNGTPRVASADLAPSVTPIQPKQSITPPAPVIQSREQKPEYQYDPEVKTISDLTGVELEAEPYYNQDRENKIRAKQKAMLIADTLRLIGQGVAGTNGMLINKDPENKGMHRTQAEIERMRELYDADVRRVRDINLNKAIREIDLKNQREFRAQELAEQRAYNEQLYNQKNVDAVELEAMRQENALEREDARYKNNQSTIRAEIKERERIAKEKEAETKAKADLEKEVYATVNGFIDMIDNEPDYKKKAEIKGILSQRLQRALEGNPSKEEMIEIYQAIKGYKLKKLPDPTGKVAEWSGDVAKDGGLLIYEVNGQQVTVNPSELEEFNKVFPNAKRIK